MKRVTKILGLALVVTAILVVSLTSTVFAANGPAPNSGDCIPDGSGLETPLGVGGGIGFGTGHGGPAPNSGDCNPDGSGW